MRTALVDKEAEMLQLRAQNKRLAREADRCRRRSPAHVPAHVPPPRRRTCPSEMLKKDHK